MAYPEIQQKTQLIVGNAEKFVVSVKFVPMVSVQQVSVQPIAMIDHETHPTIQLTVGSAEKFVLSVKFVPMARVLQVQA